MRGLNTSNPVGSIGVEVAGGMVTLGIGEGVWWVVCEEETGGVWGAFVDGDDDVVVGDERGDDRVTFRGWV